MEGDISAAVTLDELRAPRRQLLGAAQHMLPPTPPAECVHRWMLEQRDGLLASGAYGRGRIALPLSGGSILDMTCAQ